MRSAAASAVPMRAAGLAHSGPLCRTGHTVAEWARRSPADRRGASHGAAHGASGGSRLAAAWPREDDDMQTGWRGMVVAAGVAVALAASGAALAKPDDNPGQGHGHGQGGPHHDGGVGGPHGGGSNGMG